MKINRSVIVNGTRKWIHANSEQEYAEKLLKLSASGVEKIQAPGKHIFVEYAENWFEVYSGCQHLTFWHDKKPLMERRIFHRNEF